MPYFGELQDLLNDVSHWADLRHEQGEDVSATVKRLRKEAEITIFDETLKLVKPTKKPLKDKGNQ